MKIPTAPKGAARPPLTGGEIRRIVILAVTAGVLLIFIARGVLKQNEKVEAGTPLEVQVQTQGPGEIQPPPSVPDGSHIVLPEEGDPKALLAVRDHTEMDLAEEGLLYLLRAIAGQTSEEIAARVDSTVPAGDLLKDPGRYRGRYVRSIGTIDHLEQVWLPLDNPTGIERAWQGYIFPRNERPVHFIALDLDPERELKLEHDTVMVEGPFLKIHTYESVIGKTIAFPMLVARNVRHVDDVTYEKAYPKELGYIAVVVVVLVVLLIGAAMLRSSRRDAAAEEERRKHRQDRRQKSGGETP